MNKYGVMLPQEKPVYADFNYFPTRWQAVLFRNYGKIPAERLASVLRTDVGAIYGAAKQLGLSALKHCEGWTEKGYITVIRNNWFLLGYRQLAELLDIDFARLSHILYEEDDLGGKLGGFKPEIDEVRFTALTAVQSQRTQRIRELMEKHIIPDEADYFNFYKGAFKDYGYRAEGEESIADRIIYSYNANFGDVLLSGDFSAFSEEYLNTLRSLGVNGLWVRGELKSLTEFPFMPEMSRGRQTRIANLQKLIKHLSRHGMKLYMYLNEPRSMPTDFFSRYPQLRGASFANEAALCTSTQEVKDYFYNAVKELAQNAPGLGGIISITMSESFTNCFSASRHRIAGSAFTHCQRCASRTPGEVAAEVNTIMKKALDDAGTEIELIVWNWGWSDFMGWAEGEAESAISSLPAGITLQCVSEDKMKIEKGGVKSEIIDYSISNSGPSPHSMRMWKVAKKAGLNLSAKLQINNSWECSAVPFIPVFDTLYDHMTNLSYIGMDKIMLGWTLGGYPTLSLDLVSNFYQPNVSSLSDWYKKRFGDNADAVSKACALFSSAFKEYPFDLEFLYNGPHNYGCANIFYDYDIDLKSTIIGFPYEDINAWRGVYPQEVLLTQLQKLCRGWKRGLDLLSTVQTDEQNFCDVKLMAQVLYCHFYSSSLLTEWIIAKHEDKPSRERLSAVIDKEFDNTLALLRASSQHPTIGYEASNHYLYNKNTLLEKLVNLDYLKDLQFLK